MSAKLRFDDRVVIVTGAGNGLGRSHALEFARRGAKLVVNDLGGSATGDGKSSAAADEVVALIREAGGEAVANYDSVEDGARVVETAMDTWGRVDVVVNNAGILRDTSFAKLTEEDWDLIYRVHVLGSFRVTHAAWPIMREQNYGRIVMTTSAAGLYGNFGQANYAMAKMGLVGFGQTLAIEGFKRNILTNVIAPLAGSRMTETILPPNLIEALRPEYVTPLVAWLCHESCEENGGVFEVGGGFFGKLRWERAPGRMYRTGRDIAVEDVRSSWDRIAGFDEGTTHPDSVTASLSPILENVNAGPSKGGNALIDCDEALGFEFPDVTSSYDERDLAIYALGVGAAADPTDDNDLQLVYEMHGEGFKALPTFGVVPAVNLMLDMGKRGETAPGMNYGIERMLHGEQYTEIVRPLPRAATLKHRARIVDIFDKGKNALVVTETKSYDEDDNLLIVNRLTAVIRGAGGWGGDRGAAVEKNTPPDRAPDAVTEQVIGTSQALLYRLSGDWNPLHADPAMAAAFGFPKPILHGLCTFGYAGRHVIDAFAPERDPRYFKSIEVRFADTVFPGETLVTKMWKEDGRILFECAVKEREATVINRAAIELYEEIPAPPPKKAEIVADEAPAAADDAPNSGDIFVAIGRHEKATPDLLNTIGTVFQFKLADPASVWTLDLVAGSVAAGETAKPQCTLTLSDADFMDMCQGVVDPMKLYMDQKLKIGGDVMASQKLDFLKKIDPESVLAAARERAGGGGDSTAAAAASEPSDEASARESIAAQFFENLASRVAHNPGLAAEVGAVVHFRLTDPESEWTLDLASSAGAVSDGLSGDAAAIVTLSEETLVAWARGTSTLASLHQTGDLRVDGDIGTIKRLGILNDVI